MKINFTFRKNYIFYFDENTQESLGKKMREVLNMSPEELQNKGASARRFALEEKNNVVQSAKIIDFCFGLKRNN